MKCLRCDDCKFVEDCVDYGWQDCKKFTPKPSEPMTNEEYLRSLNTEELALWIERIMFIVRYRKEVEDGAYMQTITKKDYIEKWLKEIHNEMSTMRWHGNK